MSIECSECELDHDEHDEPDDPRDAVCEATSRYLLGLGTPEFALANGGLQTLLQKLRDAVFAWENPDGS